MKNSSQTVKMLTKDSRCFRGERVYIFRPMRRIPGLKKIYTIGMRREPGWGKEGEGGRGRALFPFKFLPTNMVKLHCEASISAVPGSLPDTWLYQYTDLIWVPGAARIDISAGAGESRVAATLGPLNAPRSLAFELLLERHVCSHL